MKHSLFPIFYIIIAITFGCNKKKSVPKISPTEVSIPKEESAASFLDYQPLTSVSIIDTSFLINNKPTYEDIRWEGHSIEGLLFNANMVQGIFDDEHPANQEKWKYPDGKFTALRNTTAFVEAMPSWKAHGLLAFNLNMQGSDPMRYNTNEWHNTAYDSLGNLKEAYLIRLDMILQQADALEMVVILGLFNQYQDQTLKDEMAVIAAVDNTINWLHKRKYRHVLIEINEECDARAYNHAILKEYRVHELMMNVKLNVQNDYQYLVSTSFEGHVIPTENVIEEADFVLLNGVGVNEPFRIMEMVEITRNLPNYRKMPILFTKDNHYAFDLSKNNCKVATLAYASWGYYDYRKKGESFANGFQSIPVDWRISSPRKKWFFNYIKKITRDSIVNL